jgi:hypothetical protein
MLAHRHLGMLARPHFWVGMLAHPHLSMFAHPDPDMLAHTELVMLAHPHPDMLAHTGPHPGMLAHAKLGMLAHVEPATSLHTLPSGHADQSTSNQSNKTKAHTCTHVLYLPITHMYPCAISPHHSHAPMCYISPSLTCTNVLHTHIPHTQSYCLYKERMLVTRYAHVLCSEHQTRCIQVLLAHSVDIRTNRMYPFAMLPAHPANVNAAYDSFFQTPGGCGKTQAVLSHY